MQNINFNNKAMTKNKKELCRTMQKISKIYNEKQPLNKERKGKERYFEKVKAISSSKVRFSSSKQLPPALTLRKLSDDSLLSQTKALVQKERKLNIEILQHLQEIESRKLYLERGFSSLFDYTVKELGYGEGAAYRRIKTMKLCQDIPETKTQIESGQLNLSTASQLQNFFEKQKRKSKMKLKNHTVPSNTKPHSKNSVQQVLRNVSSLRRNSALSSENHDLNLCFSKEKPSLKNLENAGYSSEEVIQNKGFENLNQKKNLIKKTLGKSQAKTQKLLSEVDPEVCQQKEKTRFIGNQKIELKVILDEDCFKSLENLKNLLSHKNPRMSYGELIGLLAELGLKKYDSSKKINQKTKRKKENQKFLKNINLNSPHINNAQINKKLERKSKEECNNTNLNLFNKKNQNSSDLSTNDIKSKRGIENKNDGKIKIQKKIPSNKNLNKPKIKNKKMLSEYTIQNKFQKINRSIPQKIRQYIWKRDQGECSYVCMKTKNKCRSKHLLQIDHIQPFALGGSHHPDNLRLLCVRHNQLRSQKTFGFKP